ncbi:sodium/glutamate symporter [Desulfovibrio inopinatus]|uniref:sodium/glutamate symporter n=1 Tax=Desulfovibrio inopinatus TaxID=102109 RepID=UPI0003F9CE24|nr:sodium/glutamate symporter [Desulfovibrio inopinatus]
MVFTAFIIFKIMGKDYEAAVICAGFGGISMGSTPTAIANMTAVTERYGAAHKAFIVVPLVCSFFIDVANAMIISFFVMCVLEKNALITTFVSQCESTSSAKPIRMR